MKQFITVLIITWSIFSCHGKKDSVSADRIREINLKRGELISCGPPGKEFGELDFQTSLEGKLKEDFNLAVKLLHSFEYDEAEKEFAKIIDAKPGCAMAYWGVAMANFHALWTPPTEEELKKGNRALEIAKSITDKTKRESEYIDAISALFSDWEKKDHHSRCLEFEKKMEELHQNYPDDNEASIFYALSLDAAADPADKTFGKQKKAGNILNELYQKFPDHPGIIHYIIHTYDNPEMASLALPAARRYAQVAPSSAHATHMPSHIFTRLGMWEDCIRSNKASVASAQCYAESAGIKGHWDEELHGLDYLVYSYLQTGNNSEAKKLLDYLSGFKEVNPLNFKVAYAFAAIPSRYLLENGLWKEASQLKPKPDWFDWKNYGWQKAIIYFTRAMGAIKSSQVAEADKDLDTLLAIREDLVRQKDNYKSNQVDIQIKTIQGWIEFKKGNTAKAIELVSAAADEESHTDKHPVTPCEVIPAIESLGDLYLELHQPANALEAYQKDLQNHPNRFNGLLRAGMSAEQSGDKEKAKQYYQQLLSIAEKNSERKELAVVNQYLQKN